MKVEFKVITESEQAVILTNNVKKCAWGWHFPSTATGAIGARLIYDRYCLSTISGRVASLGEDTKADKTVFDMTAETKLLSVLFDFMRKEQGIREGGPEIVYGKYKDFHILATPNGSFGYVYLSAWTEED